MEQEELKWIDGYEGLYIVTSFGRVFSTVRRDRFCRITGGGEVKQHLSGIRRDYHFVMLYKKGVGRQYSVHQLVAKAFLPNPDNKPQVDHIDNDKSNNKVSNLRWVTQVENMANPITKKRRLDESDKYAKTVGKINTFSRKVSVYTIDGDFIGNFDSGGLAKKALGLPKNLDLSRVCNGNRPQTHGYVFKYLSEAKMKITKRADNSYSRKPVVQLDLDGNVVSEYDSIKDAAKSIGVHSSNIGKAIRGQFKTCGGYKWKFK